MQSELKHQLLFGRRWLLVILAVVTTMTLIAAGTVSGRSALPEASALPCPDGSNTCGPTAPILDPGPTGNQGPGTTAPQAPTTLAPTADNPAPTAPQQNGGPEFQGTVMPQPTVTQDPDTCIVNCPTQVPTPTPTLAPTPKPEVTQVLPTTKVPPQGGQPTQSQLPQQPTAHNKCIDAQFEFGLVSAGGGSSVPIVRAPTPNGDTGCDCSDTVTTQVQLKTEDPVFFDTDCEPYRFGDMANHVSTMPCGYIYDPDSEVTPAEDVARHDYCTSSPDSFPGGNLRPICARHDMCMDEMDREGTSESEGAFKYRTCNNFLHEEFKEYCNSLRWYATYQCTLTADIYYLAITGSHLNF